MKADLLIPTRNVLQLGEAIESAVSRRPGSGRLVVCEGPAGTGKTSSAKAIAMRYRGAYYSVPELITPRSLISGIVDSLVGWRVDMYSVQALHERLFEELEQREWPPLLIDEADRLDRVRGGCHLLEVVRDIHDHARCKSPIILLSIGRLARRLENATGYAAAVSTRICARVAFSKCTLKDAKLLASGLLEGVKLDDDLIAHCLAQSRDSIRPLLGLYAEIEQIARAAEIQTVSLAKWEQLASYAAPSAPAPRPSKRTGSDLGRRKVA